MPGSPRKRARRETAAGVEGETAAGVEKPSARARGEKQPPFEQGNKLAVTHGAYSESEIAAVADEIWPAMYQELVRANPGILPVDNLIWEQAKRVSGQIELMERRIDQVGLLSAEDELPKFWPYLEKLYRHRLDLLEQLGATPLSRMKLVGAGLVAQREATAAVEAHRRLQERDKARRKRK